MCVLTDCLEISKHASEISTTALKPKATSSETQKRGYLWSHTKGLMTPKYFKNECLQFWGNCIWSNNIMTCGSNIHSRTKSLTSPQDKY